MWGDKGHFGGSWLPCSVLRGPDVKQGVRGSCPVSVALPDYRPSEVLGLGMLGYARDGDSDEDMIQDGSPHGWVVIGREK